MTAMDGRAWWALLVGLGVLGLASLVLPMVADLADGVSLAAHRPA